MIPAVGRYRSASVLKQIILTSGTSWTVPSDWNSANNTVECIGAGGGGTTDGGGGAYALKNNLSLTAGASVSYAVGVTRTSPDTWFVNTSTVLAKGATGIGGGQASVSVGDLKYSGGAAPNAANRAGGGGAAGPNGAGASVVANATPGGNGDAGFGGGGGAFSSTGNGGNGGNGAEWGTAGSGGGGGGSMGFVGGNGGLYGGGGGSGTAGYGTGAPGVIVITYTP